MKTFHRTIIFTKTPLEGYFRYKDEFQVFPANFENMPKSKLQRHYPVVLEYVITENETIVLSEFEGLEDLATLTATTISKVDKLLNLLTLHTNHIFFRYHDTNGTWGLPILYDNSGEEANEWSSKWNLSMFYWPEMASQLKIDSFSVPICEEVEYVRHFEYYMKNPNIDFDIERPISFPNSIYSSLDSYFSLEKEDLIIVNAAIDHMESSIELRFHKKTLSTISAFTAIETMVNHESRDITQQKCELCGQLQFKVAKKFRDYLLKYIGKSTSNKKKFNTFYSMRSKILHTGEPLETEKLWNNLPKSVKDKEFLSHMEIIQLAKFSIIHWLIRNK